MKRQEKANETANLPERTSQYAFFHPCEGGVLCSTENLDPWPYVAVIMAITIGLSLIILSIGHAVSLSRKTPQHIILELKGKPNVTTNQSSD